MPGIGLILLAAGGSARLGVPKQLAHAQGVTLLRRAAETATASKCDKVVVVLGAHRDACATELVGLPVVSVWNPDWGAGMGTSLRAGMEALLADEMPDAVILMLCDQLLLTPAVLDAMVDCFQTGGNQLIASEYAGVLGVPALFSSELFPELLALNGEEGARSVIKRHRSHALAIPFPEGAIDIDTPADLANLEKQSL